MYQTADQISITPVGPSEVIFRRLCEAMGKPEMAKDPRYASNPSRVAHIETLDAAIADWCGSLDFKKLSATLDCHSVPHSKVYDIDDVMEDPHFKARKAIIRLPDRDLGEIPAPCIVPRFEELESPVPHAGPAVGEHNEAFYGALGISAEEIQRLRAAQVVYTQHRTAR